MKGAEQAFLGQWRIIEMEIWDADYFDMEVPAHITIRKDFSGELQFGMVQGVLDGRVFIYLGDDSALKAERTQ